MCRKVSLKDRGPLATFSMESQIEKLSTFGEILKAFRCRRRLTQQQLADRLGVRRNTVGGWERGDGLPATKTMVLELARLLLLDQQESRLLLEASLTTLSPHWLIPLSRNSCFTGREEILQALHAHLRANQTVGLPQSVALHGLGGVGKTQIALEYAYRYALHYSAIFWIAAETEEQIISGFLRIAEILLLPGRDQRDQKQAVEAAGHWLSTHKEWLLIWDNVEDLDLLARFLPPTREGAMLLTTRRRNLGTLASGLELLPMEQQEGLLFLLRRAKVVAVVAEKEQMASFAAHHPYEYGAAAEVVNATGSLPLALDQAGAYVEATQCGFQEYLSLFGTRRSALLASRGEGVREHPASVSTTFLLAMNDAQRRHPAVGDLLRVCAYLAPDAIPEELFRGAAAHLGPTLWKVCSDDLEWNRVVSLACGFSLLSRQPEQRTLSIHRLIQAVIQDEMHGREQKLWRRKLVRALNSLFPPAQNWSEEVWKSSARLLPHTLILAAAFPASEEDLQLAQVLLKAANFLTNSGQHEQGGQVYQRALRIQEQILGPCHLEVAQTLFSLGHLCCNQGRYEQAESLHQRVLQIREHALGPEHPEVAHVLQGLTWLYSEQSKYEQAEQVQQRALSIQEQTLDPEHPAIAKSLYWMGNLSTDQGKYEQAESFYQQARRIWERAYGPQHTNVALVLQELGMLYSLQRKDEMAKAAYQQSLSLWEQALGPDFIQISFPLNGLANLFCQQGFYEKAECLYQRALTLREQKLNPQHPEIAQTLHDLSICRQKQGRLKEAISLAERALTIREQVLGNAHPKTLATRTLSAQLLRQQEQMEREKVRGQCSEEGRDAARDESMVGDVSVSHRGPVSSTPSEGDPLQGFLADCCELHPRAFSSSRNLWQAYEHWANEHQEQYPLSRRAFITQLKRHGCQADRTEKARIWRGIALTSTRFLT